LEAVCTQQSRAPVPHFLANSRLGSASDSHAKPVDGVRIADAAFSEVSFETTSDFKHTQVAIYPAINIIKIVFYVSLLGDVTHLLRVNRLDEQPEDR
jgi:hypothetical protein